MLCCLKNRVRFGSSRHRTDIRSWTENKKVRKREKLKLFKVFFSLGLLSLLLYVRGFLNIFSVLSEESGKLLKKIVVFILWAFKFLKQCFVFHWFNLKVSVNVSILFSLFDLFMVKYKNLRRKVEKLDFWEKFLLEVESTSVNLRFPFEERHLYECLRYTLIKSWQKDIS